MSDITSCLYHVTEFVVSLEEEDSEQSSVVVDLLTDILMSAQRKSQQTTDTDKVVTNQVFRTPLYDQKQVNERTHIYLICPCIFKK